jgi:nucleoside-diphosphate-sugar epimerase
MTPVLVTGGAGFIGSHLVEELIARGRPVRVLDNFSSGKKSNLLPGAEIVEGDLRDPAAVTRSVAGCDTVCHLAALASVPRSIERPEETNAVNVEGTLSLLLAAARAKVRRVVFASSSSVYGETPVLPKHESMVPEPLSPYAVSKLAGEHYGRVATAHFGIEVVSLRFFNVYGPRQDPGSPYAAVIPIFLSALSAGRPLPVFGDGDQTRDFTFVKDVVDGILLAAEAMGAAGRLYNLAGGRPVTVLEMAHVLGRVAGRPVEIEHRPPRAGDIRHSYCDAALAERELGFRAAVDLEEGLRKTWRWFSSS